MTGIFVKETKEIKESRGTEFPCLYSFSKVEDSTREIPQHSVTRVRIISFPVNIQSNYEY